LISHYAQALVILKAFTPLLYHEKAIAKRNLKNTFELSPSAMDDLKILRALVWIAMGKKELIGRPLMTLSTRRPYIQSDASTSVGAGGILTFQTKTGTGRGMTTTWERETLLRWHPLLEKPHILQFRVDGYAVQPDHIASINVLEFFIVMMMIIENVDVLCNTSVFTLCDNKAANSWIRKIRGSTSGSAPVAVALLRIFSLVCETFNIVVYSKHIPGEFNKRSDLLSRIKTYSEQDPMPLDPRWGESKNLMMKWSEQSLKRTARVLLNLTLRKPESMHMMKLLSVVTSLTGLLGKLPANPSVLIPLSDGIIPTQWS
jgi:hypothetical protein